MKKIIILLLLFAVGVQAQNKELKQAEKLYVANDIDGAALLLENSTALFAEAKPKVKAKKTFLEAKIAQAKGEFEKAFQLYEAVKNETAVAADWSNQRQTLLNDIINSAIEDNQKEAYDVSSTKLYLAYTFDKDNNQQYLYYAASSAVNGKLYDRALDYYIQLRDLKYDGITTKYFATSVETGEETEVSASEYKLYAKTKDFTNLREEQTESRFPEIVKNIALIYAQLGDNDKAIAAVEDARKANPEDLNLILTEANIYIELGEKEKFKSLMTEAIAQDPNNANLYFNLGVVNADLGDKEAARQYYEKSIEIDPSFESGYLNLVALILEGESALVEEMNSLGNSRADNARYDVLKKEREELYRECIPILNKIIDLNQNENAVRTLMNIYGTLGDTDGFKKMKSLLDE
ncbi:MAG: tetratricopeptide repeat protein [Flavobacteriaceae bacterium]